MSPGYILLWIVGIASFSLLRRGYSGGPRLRGWLYTAILILTSMAGTYLVLRDLDLAGYVGAALWAWLVLFPMTSIRFLERWSQQSQKLQSAILLASVLRLFHPLDGYWEIPAVLKKLQRLQSGEFLPPGELQRELESLPSRLSRNLHIYLFSFLGDWAGLIQWFEREIGIEHVESDPYLAPVYVRALGETGQLPLMLHFYGRYESELRRAGIIPPKVARLFVLAFSGQTAEVKKLVEGPLAEYPTATQTFWLATAELAAGNLETGREMLRPLENHPDARIRRGVERRLRSGVSPAGHFAGVLPVLVDEESPFPAAPPPRRPIQWVTQVLIALNLIYFGMEIWFGGSTNGEVLFMLGGLLPEAVLNGEYWRLVASMFLHFGPLHIAMNLFALYAIGPFVEQTLRWWGYLLLYFFSGISSMLTVTLLVAAGVLHDQFLVGASGAISGLIGATGALLLYEWRQHRNPVTSRRLNSIGMAVLLQVAFDLSTRQVSFTAHLSGAIAGFIFTLVWIGLTRLANRKVGGQN